ncbi:hypothetical protein Leryth_026324 [Lithospermum erythrorhizon]|nr:hypothetical protein Leryth_026324 [Lithospermum erythrorhizon]
MSSTQNDEAICGEEALDLLNCVTESPYNEEKCSRLLRSLRQCVLNKVIFLFNLIAFDTTNDFYTPTSNNGTPLG